MPRAEAAPRRLGWRGQRARDRRNVIDRAPSCCRRRCAPRRREPARLGRQRSRRAGRWRWCPHALPPSTTGAAGGPFTPTRTPRLEHAVALPRPAIRRQAIWRANAAIAPPPSPAGPGALWLPFNRHALAVRAVAGAPQCRRSASAFNLRRLSAAPAAWPGRHHGAEGGASCCSWACVGPGVAGCSGQPKPFNSRSGPAFVSRSPRPPTSASPCGPRSG